MRICVISTPIFGFGPMGLVGYGGLEHLSWQLAAGLSKLGHEMGLVCPGGSVCPGVTVIPNSPQPGLWDEKTAYGSNDEVKRKLGYEGYWSHLLNFDALVDMTWQKWSYALKQEGRFKGPILGVCHAPVDTMFKELPEIDKPCFVCISKDQADHFQALFNRKAEVAYNGVDSTYYAPLSVPRTDRFLFLARFSTIKGPDIAIEACREAGVSLDLIGDTSITNEPELFQKCNRMCDGKNIRMVGPVSRGESVWWYSQAHCMVHPNQRFKEPFGLAPIEANLCGCPVIAWDNGAMRETIAGRGGALVTSYADLVQMVKETANGFFTEDYRNKCRERAKEFSVERMCLRYQELIHMALDSKGGW